MTPVPCLIRGTMWVFYGEPYDTPAWPSWSAWRVPTGFEETAI